ncbi:Hypothetical Protein FCC1311_012832 [Hondaea fermentalgiana]|uniref:Uncharacterized protein n=1 Tax=Hondaea fermentalgiana TaxID=2315210 RepID=A0A2R5G226_9STRA|nr:Hypothetical Protein FCC1311_012832 [Hondaea fermentalgiana]|eukprot:GBG25066.1 Hypothetical Protein FCC1311_012832 [Hondaea fermentalgiana]
MPQVDIPSQLMPSTQLAEVEASALPRRGTADGRRSAAQLGSLVQVGALEGGLAGAVDPDMLDEDGNLSSEGRRRLQEQRAAAGQVGATSNAMGMMSVEDEEGEVIILDDEDDAAVGSADPAARAWKGWHEIPSLYRDIPGRTVVTLPHVRSDVQRMDTTGVLRHFELEEKFKATPASLRAVDEPRLCLLVQLPDLLPIPSELRINEEEDEGSQQQGNGNASGAGGDDEAPVPPVKQEPGAGRGGRRRGPDAANASQESAPGAGSSVKSGIRNPFTNVKSGKLGTLCIRRSGKAYIVGEDASATELRVVPGFNVSCADDLVLLRCQSNKKDTRKRKAKGKNPRSNSVDMADDSDVEEAANDGADLGNPANEMIVLNGTKGRIKIVPNLEML